MEKDLEVFSEEERYIETKDGERIFLPRLTWGKELQIIRIISEFLNDIPEIKELDMKNLSPEGLLPIISKIFEKGPNRITRILSLLFEKEGTWIENSLAMEGIMQFLVPFFYFKGKSLAENFNKIKTEMKKEAL